eukprot:TRINITY_DN1924_c0_g1_i2.p1 TRINITY_DN1924_c0_g1~~TRINITY_DN1924_c0_g1_i2.p1  ORF type:complete len:104 (-),score=65.80 TRINITY_DN1924_c0_g1_i2:258-569(-)
MFYASCVILVFLFFFFFLMIRRPPRSTQSRSSAASDVYKRQVNKCGVVSPRFDMTTSSNEQWVTNLLPSRQFGHIVLTTSQGIMDHNEAKRKQIGGKILGYFF